MTDDNQLFDLTRRKMLGSLGALGVGAALGGAGTAAFFSDEETFENNQLTAGSLDLKVDWTQHYYDGSGDSLVSQYPESGEILSRQDIADKYSDKTVDDPAVEEEFRAQFADVPDDLEAPLLDLDDIKPGDEGEVTFSLHLFDNPGYIWMNGDLLSADENGVNEPESKDPDEIDGVVELLDIVRTSLWYDDGDNELEDGETIIFEDVSLRDALDFLDANDGLGIPLGEAQATDGNGVVEPVVGPGTCSTETSYDSLHQSGTSVTVDGEEHTISDNPKCSEFGLEEVLKIGPGEPGGELPGDGNTAVYTTPYGDIEVTQDGETIQWRTDSSPDGSFEESEDGFCMSKVVVKGGNEGGNVYSYDNDDGDDNFDNDDDATLSSGETDAWLTTPSDQDISHVSFCIDAVPSGGNGNGGNGRECFQNSTTQYFGFSWWVPVDHGNEMQTDSAKFDLGFYTEQCRHNDGSGMTWEESTNNSSQ